MRHARATGFLARRSHSEGLLFSAAFVGAIIAITSALYAIDVAAARALLSLP
jgi:hypothetical protein